MSVLLVSAAQADFGVVPGSFHAVPENRDGSIDMQAGSHPYQYKVSFSMKTTAEGTTEGGELRDAIVDLPPGLIGDPLATPRCSRADFEGSVAKCPIDTQVGVLRAAILGVGEIAAVVYNLVPPTGVAAQIGFSAGAYNTLENASVLTEDGYGVSVEAINLPLEVKAVTETIWGTP
ncbi:MAG TPA: hypothetical protein VK680_12365, partial [Solirubrobacteraceae bacterium]|nr:hypothetical protein [Solirubrobacteraceae bacterium]